MAQNENIIWKAEPAFTLKTTISPFHSGELVDRGYRG
jgi:hypothetical protein